jgi:peptide/nickel transport system ATP-binding protein
VEAGTVKDIFLQAQHPYTQALLACRPVLHQRGKRLPVVSDFLDIQIKEEIKTVNSEDQIDLTSNIGQRTSDSSSSTPILKVQNLKVYFPIKTNFFGKTISQFKAVDDVSFEIMKGETVGLVGESGCGKTTLGRTLIRLIEPTSGNILFDGKDIAHINKMEMRRMRKDIQIIFQDPYGSLNPRITIGNAVQEPMKIHGLLQNNKQRKDKVIELLEKVNLKAEHFNRYPHEFSGGQRQRICIARALGLNPEFLICDESVSALDVSVQAQVLNLLNDLKKEFGFTSIFISHDLSVVRYISDRIMVMNKGKIEETGPADEVYFNPKNDYTKKLIASIPKGVVV